MFRYSTSVTISRSSNKESIGLVGRRVRRIETSYIHWRTCLPPPASPVTGTILASLPDLDERAEFLEVR
jgi:hypothetical protein